MYILYIDNQTLNSESIKALLQLKLNAKLSFSHANSTENAIDTIDNSEIIIYRDDVENSAEKTQNIDKLVTHYKVPLVVLTNSNDPHVTKSLVESKALTYIQTTSENATDTLLETLRKILLAKQFISVQSIEEYLLIVEKNKIKENKKKTVLLKLLLKLSLRQSEIFWFIVQGNSNKVIARKLNLSPSTVKNHVVAIFRILDIATREQAIFMAAKNGLLTLQLK